MDSGSFEWTDFVVYVTIPHISQLRTVTYVISGGTNFPVDDFTNPYAFGIAGIGFSARTGAEKLATFELAIPEQPALCVSPMLDAAHPQGLTTYLFNGSSYHEFATGVAACWHRQAQPAALSGGVLGTLD